MHAGRESSSSGIISLFVEMDSQLNADQRLTEDISGSTGIMLILDGDNHVYAASVGDSKCIVRNEAKFGVYWKHIFLS